MSTGPVSTGPKLVNSCSHFTQKWFHLCCWISDENFAHVPPSPHIRRPFYILIFLCFFLFFCFVLFCYRLHTLHSHNHVFGNILYCILFIVIHLGFLPWRAFSPPISGFLLSMGFPLVCAGPPQT